MTTLAVFLLARIAEDEVDARSAAADEGGSWIVSGRFSLSASFGTTDGVGSWSGLTELRRDSIADHIARHDPARVLAECEAKRRIVEQLTRAANFRDDDADYEEASEDAVKALAAVYADHPDYDESWRP